ncbi:MAG TPA: MASE3 domain-containing protein [Chloroflexota bacterium]
MVTTGTSPRHSLQRILLAAAAAVIGLAIVGLWESRFYFVFSSEIYLPLHALAEMASVVVSFAIFALYWNAYGEFHSARGVFLGTAFLGVAILDVFHILGFPGMPPFISASSVDKGIWFFVSARLWATSALVISTFVPDREQRGFLSPMPLIACNLAGAGAIFVVVSFMPERLPAMFIQGLGVTPLKVAFEWVILGLSLAGGVTYARAYLRSGERFFELLAIALVIGGIGELFFTLYSAAYDVYNFTGHVYKVISYYLIFSALFVSAIQRPYRELAWLYDQIENELKRTIARLDTTIAAIPVGVVIYNPSGNIVRMNSTAEQILGLESSDAIIDGLRLVSAEKPDGTPWSADEMPASLALHGETVQGVVMDLRRPDGRKVSVSASAAPIETGRGREGAVVSFTEVTRLLQLQQRQEDLVRMVSHDLRSPLTAIYGQAQLMERMLLRSGGDDKIRQSASGIVLGARRMEAMIRDLVEIAKVESGQQEANRMPVALAPFAGELLERLAAAMDSGRIVQEIGEGLPELLVDPNHLERILTNLLSNALKYSAFDMPVRLRAEGDGQWVRISVTDRGSGIPSDEIPRLFERFYRSRTTKKAEGLGLGLFITRTLVEANGGWISVESEVGVGSTFQLVLPVAEQSPPGGVA